MSYTLTSKRILADLFTTIAELEVKCEMARLDLNQNPFFEPFNAFTILDIEKHGQLRDSDIFNFCLDNGIPCTYADASFLIAQYDENSNGKLSFTEFTQFALPATDEVLRQTAAQRDYSYTKSNSPLLPPDVTALLANLIASELDYQRATGAIKQDLNSRVDFTTKHAFGWMDVTKPLGGIDRHDIRQFVDAHSRFLNEIELDAIIRRCDTDGDESLSYLEFLEVVQGIEPSIPQTTHSVHTEVHRASSPLRETHVTRTYHSPPRAGGSPVVTTVERSPGRVTTTTRSPERVTTVHRSPERVTTVHRSPERVTSIHRSPSKVTTTVHRSPGRVETHHYSPSRTHVQYSPYRAARTYVAESPRVTHVVRRSPARHSPARHSPIRHSPARYSVTRHSPFTRTVTSFTRNEDVRPVTTHITRTSPARVETRYVSSPGRYSPARYSPTRVTHITRSPSRVEIEETKHYSPGRTHVTRTYHSPARGGSPLRGFEEEELAQSLIQLVTLEGRLETAKEALAHRPYFTIHDAFKIFDLSGYGKVEPIDIKDGYAKHGIHITLDEAKLIVSRYDTNKDQLLRFEEFSDIFYPLDRISGECLNDRNRRFPSGYYISPDIIDPVTREDFVRVLNLVLETENLAEHIRQKHSGRPLFDRTDAFDAINRFGKLTITQSDFQDLLARHRFFATQKELGSLMDRFDKSKKGSVLYSEFVDEITPHSPIRY